MFNILDRKQPIHQHHLIEASAGTGKTFTIENLVVRLLIEGTEKKAPLNLDQIAVVTFTRAATRDLRNRIRTSLLNVKAILLQFYRDNTVPTHCPDYLVPHLEQGSSSLLKKIDETLSLYDQANIDTIHGFCAKMLSRYPLEAHQTVPEKSTEPQSYRDFVHRAIGEFLRNEISSAKYTPGQLKRLLNASRGNIGQLQEKLLSTVEKRGEIRQTFHLQETLKQFSRVMADLKNNQGFTASKLLDDFLAKSRQYKGITQINKEIKPEILAAAQRFATLFDKNAWTITDLDVLITDGLLFVDLFEPSNLLKKQGEPPHSLHYPHLHTTLAKELAPLIRKSRHPAIIFAAIAWDCQQSVKQQLAQKELATHQDLLQKMAEAVKQPRFIARVQQRFKAMIVDEFQDTDPLQWDIFSTLFLNHAWEGSLYLVGDPKQSIYGFRQADIYTYIDAATQLSTGSTGTLDTNYRSHASLVAALNFLFQEMHTPFPLPTIAGQLPYRTVAAGKELAHPTTDGKGSIEFWISEEKIPYSEYEAKHLIPALINEINQLKNQGIAYHQCAILVKDATQARQVELALVRAGIPLRKQRGIDLGKTEAANQLKLLLKGILHHRNKSDLLLGLTTRPIGWSHADLLNRPLDPVLNRCASLKSLLDNYGFGHFYREFMASSWKESGSSVLESLVENPDNKQFYRDWQDLADVITREELKPEEIIDWIEQIQTTRDDEQESLKGYLDPDDTGVALLTVHVSKGLEFDFVFAVGLVKKSAIREELIPIAAEMGAGKRTHFYIPVDDTHAPEYQLFCQEIKAEKLRQLYVAFTRAKYRLYVPVLFEKAEEPVSATDLFLEQLPLKEINYASFCAFIAPQQRIISTKILNATPLSLSLPHQPIPPLLVPPKQVEVHFSPLRIQSFTSISLLASEESEPDDDALATPQDFDHKEKTAHTLPAGNETGLLLHSLYEHIRFEEVRPMQSPEELVPFVTSFTKGTRFEPWTTTIASILFYSLKTSFGSFSLDAIQSKSCYREMPFMYQCEKKQFENGLTTEPGFLKGVIDLVFEHQGKYYILDWKSNWLGPTDAEYTQEKLVSAIQEHAYDVQAALYVEALRKYLRPLDPRPFEAIFGGVYYYFVRSPSGFIMPLTKTGEVTDNSSDLVH